MSCAPGAVCVTAQLATPLLRGWLEHELIGCPPSRNSIEPVGLTGPGRAPGGDTEAV